MSEDVTLGDLLDLLRKVEGIGDLSAMFSCAIEEFLDGRSSCRCADAPRTCAISRSTTPAWLDGYEPGAPGRDHRRGRFTPPYHITRDFHGWGPWEEPYPGYWGEYPDAPREGGIAIEFTPVNELAHLPLRYNPKIVFSSERHGGEVLLETELTISFGEFVHAILWEIGFLGSPGDRNAKRGELESVMEEIEAGEAKLIPAEDLFEELGLDSDEVARRTTSST